MVPLLKLFSFGANGLAKSVSEVGVAGPEVIHLQVGYLPTLVRNRQLILIRPVLFADNASRYLPAYDQQEVLYNPATSEMLPVMNNLRIHVDDLRENALAYISSSYSPVYRESAKSTNYES